MNRQTPRPKHLHQSMGAAVNSIDIFPWNANFNIGIRVIDAQHEKLVLILNQLASHVAYQSDVPALNQIFDELTEYAIYHFKTEELIWHEFLPCDEMETNHLETHLSFISAIEKLRSVEHTQPLDTVIEGILSFLSHWLIFHMLETDRQMAMVVHALQSGMTLDAAKKQAKEQMSESMKVMIDIILTICGNHVSNTLNLIKELSARKVMEQEQRKVARALKLLSKCNSTVLHSTNEQALLNQICQLAVEVGGYLMAWVGYAENDAAKTVNPYAVSGNEEGYLKGLTITWADTELGQGPTGTSIRTGTTIVNKNFQTNPKVAWWRERAIGRGYNSSISLPLLVDKQVMGALTIYAIESTAFNSEEVGLLEELANDLALGIQSHRVRTKHQLAQEHIDKLAHFDQLTGLPNRTLFNDHFKFALSLAQRNNESLTVMFLDLDHFKNINDTLGHSIGDQLLRETGLRIKTVLRDDDTVARMGGDEFILILPNTDANGAAIVAAKLSNAISLPFMLEKHELSSTASIGIALYPHDGDTLDTLSKNADAAMYRAKEDGRNTFRFYTPAMQEKSSRNLMLHNALRQAISRNELYLHYQPQLSIKDGHIIGAEALLRWKHPELGLISPGEFIPIAEDSGLIVQIGEWVLRTAVKQMKAWLDRGLSQMVIAVNLSAVQFRQSNISEMVTNILNEIQLPPNYLELELTEAVAMDNPQKVIDVMNKLHECGIRMSIDDFGTGYSSLSYLKQFKVYKLKIDQSFVRDITNDPEDKAIVAAIISMASSLGMQTIAEGVETSGQLAFLRLQGCDEVQGYYFSKPLPPEQFEEFAGRK